VSWVAATAIQRLDKLVRRAAAAELVCPRCAPRTANITRRGMNRH